MFARSSAVEAQRTSSATKVCRLCLQAQRGPGGGRPTASGLRVLLRELAGRLSIADAAVRQCGSMRMVVSLPAPPDDNRVKAVLTSDDAGPAQRCCCLRRGTRWSSVSRPLLLPSNAESVAVCRCGGGIFALASERSEAFATDDRLAREVHAAHSDDNACLILIRYLALRTD